MATYQIYYLTSDGDVSRRIEIGCADDLDAVSESTRLRGADAVEIEIWDRARFVSWQPAVPLPRPGPIRQRAMLLTTLLATSASLAVLGGAFIK
jgi:hypothetical protein